MYSYDERIKAVKNNKSAFVRFNRIFVKKIVGIYQRIGFCRYSL